MVKLYSHQITKVKKQWTNLILTWGTTSEQQIQRDVCQTKQSLLNNDILLIIMMIYLRWLVYLEVLYQQLLTKNLKNEMHSSKIHTIFAHNIYKHNSLNMCPNSREQAWKDPHLSKFGNESYNYSNLGVYFSLIYIYIYIYIGWPRYSHGI